MNYFIGGLFIIVAFGLLIIWIRHTRIEYFNMILQLVENNEFNSLHFRHYVEKKVIDLAYKINHKNRDDHSFLRKILIDEYEWYKSILDEDSDKILVLEKKARIKTLIISEMLSKLFINL